jgi:hypothetical protein
MLLPFLTAPDIGSMQDRDWTRRIAERAVRSAGRVPRRRERVRIRQDRVLLNNPRFGVHENGSEGHGRHDLEQLPQRAPQRPRRISVSAFKTFDASCHV